MTIEAGTRSTRHGRHRSSVVEFRLFFAATFLVFLLTVAVSRLLPWNWFEHGNDDAARRSIIDEAKARADRLVPFVFMG